MAFTFKAYKGTQKSRLGKKNLAQVSAGTAAPTLRAGSKNSNGPKGGSSKTKIPANRTYKKDNAKIKSSRINYSMLKRSK